MIVRVPGQPDNDRCTSPDYVNCLAAQPLLDPHPDGVHCPFLQEALTQYCAAASVTKYIPYSEEVLSHCGTDSHRYCELYLTLAHPEHTHHPSIVTDEETADDDPTREHDVDGIRVPGWLAYSANHMWIDIGDEGNVHIGIDAFLASVLDSVERITFVTSQGVHRPTVMLTVHGVDLQMVFPHQVYLTSPNLYLRTHPQTVLTDPYTLGWLFEGKIDETDAAASVRELRRGLVSGRQAVVWMREEITRLSRMAHALSHEPDARGTIVMADGGTVEPGFIQHLSREHTLHVFNDFFSPLASWRESP
jgi:glycine cleavage system H lipoate-binding protein